MEKFFRTFVCAFLSVAFLLSACTVPQVSANDRLFLDVSVELVDTLPVLTQELEDAEGFGGISAIAYDPKNNGLYALSDDRTQPHVYTLDVPGLKQGRLDGVRVGGVTLLRDIDGNSYGPGVLDTEGLALSPRNTWIISSEGSPANDQSPFLGEYDIHTGRLQQSFRIPKHFLPAEDKDDIRGIQENLGFESLTVSTSPGMSYLDPFRLFVATEGPLGQDLDIDPEIPYKNRLLHYLLDQNNGLLLAEHLYPMETAPLGAVLHGLSEILTLDTSGHFLGLERSFGLQGFAVRLFQLAIGGATDTVAIASLKGSTEGIDPIRKELVVDFADLGIDVDNFEGMTFGPRFKDGSASLIVVSDNNFDAQKPTQFLLFRLSGLPFA